MRMTDHKERQANLTRQKDTKNMWFYKEQRGRKLKYILEGFVTKGKTYHGNSWLN